MLTRYNKEFREEAIKLSDEIGPKKASEDLGVKYSTLAEWRKQRNKKLQSQGKELSEADKDELIRKLKREKLELQQANEILKDAISFFARDRKR